MTDDLLNHRIRDYVKLAALRLLESGALPMDEICSHQFFLEGFLDANQPRRQPGRRLRQGLHPPLTGQRA